MAMKERGNVFIRRMDSVLGPFLMTFLAPSFQKKVRIPPPKKILILKLGPIGDTLLLDGVGRMIRKKYPQLHINFVSSNANLDVARRLPWVNEVYIFEPIRAIENPFYFFSWIKSMRKEQYDLILDFEQWSYIDSFIVAFLKARCKVGFKVKGRAKHLFFDIKVPHLRQVHEIENFSRLSYILGIKGWERPVFEVSEGERKTIEKYIGQDGNPVVIFHPGCGGFKGYLREWPKEKFVQLGIMLKEQYEDIRIFITGSEEERGKAEYIKEKLGNYAVSVAGKLTLGESAALIEKVQLFVSGNTGTMHVAASLGTPLIALHGPTDVKRFGPISDNAHILKSRAPCSPCLHLGFEYKNCKGGCMNLIEVREVFEKAIEILDRQMDTSQQKKTTIKEPSTGSDGAPGGHKTE